MRSTVSHAHVPMTAHARRRVQQRVIPPMMIDCLLAFGDRRDAGRGTERCYFTKKSWRLVERHAGPAAKHLEHWRDIYAVIADGAVITAAWRY